MCIGCIDYYINQLQCVYVSQVFGDSDEEDMEGSTHSGDKETRASVDEEQDCMLGSNTLIRRTLCRIGHHLYLHMTGMIVVQ